MSHPQKTQTRKHATSCTITSMRPMTHTHQPEEGTVKCSSAENTQRDRTCRSLLTAKSCKVKSVNDVDEEPVSFFTAPIAKNTPVLGASNSGHINSACQHSTQSIIHAQYKRKMDSPASAKIQAGVAVYNLQCQIH